MGKAKGKGKAMMMRNESGQEFSSSTALLVCCCLVSEVDIDTVYIAFDI